ncbi:MFS transporter [Paraburkholderia acidisoli]|uniref:MFS transporter n=1 Tax=Paraburkholderia acidisoli TaxID=2571748 RepID=A0A7Z2GN78_9BURK|nr:MFS transporter [Paraburkholderia acidisoli]QGZ64813.1 MFS transporter [Paraburkholderia acidisoli]
MKSWYSELTPVERRTYWACFGGYTLDSLDSTMYALLAPVLIAVVGLTRPEIGVLATAGLIGNAIGGWAAGIVADRYGRVSVLKFTILWVAAFSALAALASSFHAFLFVRVLQGLGYGGEAAVGGVLISEVVRPALRGRVASSVQAGFAVGYALSTGLMPVIFGLLPEATAWRVMFGIGIVPAFLVLLIRKQVPESQLFQAQAGRAVAPFWAIFRRVHLRNTLLGLLLASGILGGGFSMSAWLPTYLRTDLHLAVASTAGYLAMSIAGSLTGPFVSGWLSDRVGRRANFVLFVLCEAVVVATLLFVPIGAHATIVLIFLHGALQSGLAAGLLPVFAELFDTEIRANGSGFCATGGRGVAAIMPASVGVLSATMPLGRAMGLAALCAFAVALVAALLLPERSGTDLARVENEADVEAAPETASREDTRLCEHASRA